MHDGVLVAERYAAPWGVDSPLIGWSMTKSIVNNLIGLLVADGLLVVEDSAPVPAWRSDGDSRGDITLGNLLQMSSGLDFAEVYEPGSDATNMLFAAPGAADYALASALAHSPGTHWSYSSGTTNILSRIVRDSVDGNEARVYKYMQDRLFGPLGMTSMTVENDATGTLVGSSFSYATARDWARLGQFWLQDGSWQGRRLLPPGWMNYSITPAPAAKMGNYGAQFWLNAGRNGRDKAYPDLPESAFFAHGFNQQIVAVFPNRQVVIVRLGFTTDDSWDTNSFMSQVLMALQDG